MRVHAGRDNGGTGGGKQGRRGWESNCVDVPRRWEGKSERKEGAWTTVTRREEDNTRGGEEGGSKED